jgi:hypothetical protein
MKPLRGRVMEPANCRFSLSLTDGDGEVSAVMLVIDDCAVESATDREFSLLGRVSELCSLRTGLLGGSEVEGSCGMVGVLDIDIDDVESRAFVDFANFRIACGLFGRVSIGRLISLTTGVLYRATSMSSTNLSLLSHVRTGLMMDVRDGRVSVEVII